MRKVDRHIDRQIDRHKEIDKIREINRQLDNWAERQTDIQI